MEFLIVVGLLWVFGTLFGNKTPKSQPVHTKKPEQAHANTSPSQVIFQDQYKRWIAESLAFAGQDRWIPQENSKAVPSFPSCAKTSNLGPAEAYRWGDYRISLVKKLRHRTVTAVNRAVLELIRHSGLPFNTITWDNGTEVHGYKALEKATGIRCYFAYLRNAKADITDE